MWPLRVSEWPLEALKGLFWFSQKLEMLFHTSGGPQEGFGYHQNKALIAFRSPVGSSWISLTAGFDIWGWMGPVMDPPQILMLELDDRVLVKLICVFCYPRLGQSSQFLFKTKDSLGNFPFKRKVESTILSSTGAAQF